MFNTQKSWKCDQTLKNYSVEHPPPPGCTHIRLKCLYPLLSREFHWCRPQVPDGHWTKSSCLPEIHIMYSGSWRTLNKIVLFAWNTHYVHRFLTNTEQNHPVRLDYTLCTQVPDKHWTKSSCSPKIHIMFLGSWRTLNKIVLSA